MGISKNNISKAKNVEEDDAFTGKVEVLLESLPYIKEYFNKVVVVKIGGSMMESDDILKSVLNDLILMKYVGIKVVLIHGGGKQISTMSGERGIKTEFVDGLRVTDKNSMEIVKMVLIGDINTKIVSFLNKHGGVAMGISGNDAGFIKCSKKKYKKDGRDIDLGFVGEIESINSDFLKNILDDDYIPVIATIGSDDEGNVYNINADTCAAEIAISLNAKKMILLTDVDGIMKDNEKRKSLISRLTIAECNKLIETKKISSGMIPKVKACINALKNGAERTHILNGVKKHTILLEIFTDKGVGTMITSNKIGS
jgi:acetylglutamate kinase